MYIKVAVVAGAKKEIVVRDREDHYTITVREPAERNLANTRIREIIAHEVSVPVGKVRLISGHQNPHKILSIMD
ncbi:MAG: DUF167 domain-containing protein [Candidatus Nomurabacteria bacterium]|nr:DUF167 domain-containing protein [Candidatus Nomurabacteria bacterium]